MGQIKGIERALELSGTWIGERDVMERTGVDKDIMDKISFLINSKEDKEIETKYYGKQIDEELSI